MFLTEANLLPYLLDRKFADLESVVAGDYRVRSLSRRNRNFRVTCGAREYFIKQPKKWKASSRRTLEQEAALYWQAGVDEGFRPLRLLTPESYGYDPNHSILTLQYLSGQTNLYRLEDRFSTRVARLVGSAMGIFHRDMRSVSNSEVFPRRKPWYLSLHHGDPDGDDFRGDGAREVMRVVQEHSEFGRALDALREGWREETAIHGDWKLENCLFTADSGRIHVIDWELANWGDPFDDIGTILQSWWSLWVTYPERYPIEEIRPALRAFLEGYAAQQPQILTKIAEVGRDSAGDAISTGSQALGFEAMRYAGARMLQTAIEAVQDEDQLNAAAVRLLQASLNILTRPDQAFHEIFGAGWTAE
jgi:tRNA A-37 threonylcarbamoyl transferase component Bud32